MVLSPETIAILVMGFVGLLLTAYNDSMVAMMTAGVLMIALPMVILWSLWPLVTLVIGAFGGWMTTRVARRVLWGVWSL